ncbi:MAG: hypothetical protein OXJ52_03495 [Oligoflexia bacterium]|nr:hypothetical protein [Oligoflexia bacterium]
MIFSKQSLFIFIIAFFTAFSFAQDDSEDLDYFETEDIACEDLPEAFNKYTEDVQLNQISMQKALTSLVQFLRKTSEQGRLVEAELLKMIEDLEQMNDLSQDNSMFLSDKASDISYFLPDCITSESSAEE